MDIQIGCHVSIAGGVFKAPKNAIDLGCEAFQMFTRSPQGGSVPPITPEIQEQFKAAMKEFGFANFVIHAPYILNFGSANPRTYNGSIDIVRKDLERGSLLGADYVMFHVGSGKDLGAEKAIKQAQEGLLKVLDGYEGSTKLLLENAAGAGEVLGDSFEELAELMKPIKKHKGFGGICYDTQHGFASGYDIRNQKAVTETFEKFDKVIGLKYLKCIQVNDSKTEFNSHKDRHEHIEDGLIGKKGFDVLIDFLTHDPRFATRKSMALILETEHDKVIEDIATLKKLRDKNNKKRV